MSSQMPRLIETWQHSRQHKLTAYDALYLELASRRQLPLATQDQDLKKAATDYGLRIFF